VATVISEWPEPSAWNKNYQGLLAYVDEHGHADVPANYESADGLALGKWVSMQRTRRRKSQMPETQERRLDRLPGWIWDKQQQAWDGHFEALEHFVTREKHARVPRSHRETVSRRVLRLGQWVNNQRKAEKAGTLGLLRFSRLNAIPGWEWAVQPGTDPPAAAHFQSDHAVNYYDELRRFVEKHGHGLVPDGYRRPGSLKGDLGLWVTEQRESYANGTLSLTEKASLDVFAGWEWSELEADFQTHLHAMRQFIKRLGHIDVSDDHQEDYIGLEIHLASWLNPLLQRINDGELSGSDYEALQLIAPYIDLDHDNQEHLDEPNLNSDIELPSSGGRRKRFAFNFKGRKPRPAPASGPERPPPELNRYQPLEEGDPRELGPYRLLGRIGEGGQAVVYYAESDAGVAAVKVPRPDAQNTKPSKERFLREAGVLELIDSPHVVGFIDCDLNAEPQWIALEHLAGDNLQQERNKTRSYPNQEIEKLALGLARCLDDVHGLGIVHRDVKPSNFVMSENRPVLVDFGIALHPTVYGDGLTRLPVGTEFYQAPESTQSPASDIYSWANVLLYLKRGRPLGPTEEFSSTNTAIKATPGEILQMLRDKTFNPANDPLFAVTGAAFDFCKHDTDITTGRLCDLPDEDDPRWDADQESDDLPVVGELPGDPNTVSEIRVDLYPDALDSIQSDPGFETVDVVSWLEDNPEITIYARVAHVGAEVRLQMEGIEGQDPTGPSTTFGLGTKLSDLAVRALRPDPALRPTAKQIIAVLEEQRAARDDAPTRA